MAMGSRFKSLFLTKRSSKSSNNSLQSATPYDSILASEPPTTGPYPVAGNGPDVLEQIQRSRAKRRSQASVVNSSIAQRQEHAVQRPKTAPHDGAPGGSAHPSKSTKGRTMSGFSMKSPPNFFSSSSSGSRRNSIRSNADHPPLPPPPIAIHASAPQMTSLPTREIRTYIPTTGINPTPVPSAPVAFNAASAQHSRAPSRAPSQAPHKAYVDLLEAHSNIKHTREASLHRFKASGARSYGEDVADRNIGAFGPPPERETKLDLNSPEFSYLKSVYAPKKGVRTEPYSRASSALGHVLGADGRSGDDTHGVKSQSRTNSMRSTRSGPIPGPKYPPRVDSVTVPYGAARPRDGYRSLQPNGAVESGARAMSLSNASIAEESLEEYRSQSFGNSTTTVATPPIPERGRSRPTTGTRKAKSVTSGSHNPPPAVPPAKINSTSHSRQSSSTRNRDPSSSRSKASKMSAANEHTVGAPTANGGTGSRKGSVSFVASGKQAQQPHNTNTRKRTIVDGASQPPSLAGVVDLRDSVDTDVTTTQLPAVVHEYVTPQRHEIREEVVTREIHTHDVYHRVLPVLETEILPTKHYVRDGKNLIEIPESMVPSQKVTGRADQSWHISKPGPSQLSSGVECETSSRASTESAPDGPIVGLARGEPRHNRGASKASSSSARPTSNREPILAGKREFITKNGVPRIEYIWRHPPVFETANGETQPIYVGAGVGDISSDHYIDEDEEVGAYPASPARFTAQGEEELLYKDAGYGSEGMLPGLNSMNSWTMNDESNTPQSSIDAVTGKVKGLFRREEESTQASGRISGRRRSSAASNNHEDDGLEGGIRTLSIK